MNPMQRRGIMLGLLLWWQSAVAATFGESMLAIGWWSAFFVSLLALGGGLVSLLVKFTPEDPSKPALSSPRREIAKDMAASFAAGWTMFFLAKSITEKWQPNDTMIALAVTLAGLAGTRLLDLLVRKFLQRVEEG